MSCSWNHTVCSLFRLASLTQQYGFKVLPYLFMACLFFSFYCYIIFHHMDASLIEGHLGCFQVLAIMNKTAFVIHFDFFFNFYLFIYLWLCWSSFLCEGFLQLWQAGATLHRGARASHYRGLSCCRAQAPDAQAQ